MYFVRDWPKWVDHHLKDMIMKRLRLFFCAAAVLLTAGCAQVGLFAANAPVAVNDVAIARNVSFGPKPWQTLDIYMPPGARARPSRVVVFYYGGRWEQGRKEDYRFVGSALAKAGFVTVIPDYRKYPQVKFPVFVEDGAASLAWVYDHIDRYGGNPGAIHVAGHSAGAHIGALLTADPRYLKAEGKDRSTVIKSFAGLAGPYDFTPQDPDLKDMFGPPSRYPQMQVTHFIDGHQPPMLLLWGAADKDVEKYNLDRLQQRIEEKGGCVRTIVYPGIDHVWLVAAMAWFGQEKAPVTDDIVHFFAGGDKACE